MERTHELRKGRSRRNR